MGLGVFNRAGTLSSSFGVSSRAGTAGFTLKESASLFFFFNDVCLEGVFDDGGSKLFSCKATFVEDGCDEMVNLRKRSCDSV